ncbi:zinc finger CCHC domain-containing protein 12-like [Simochromis diagramma]|uniref:zinc finger CCHC domain-containing protein 12-like n=1 Tax=Simochromis diagramma TaxID=43689 RepID=UPI001A7EDDB6|nr:zinc finger CCHC domain-containing protein 12-like [Simochromis diagramma]
MALDLCERFRVDSQKTLLITGIERHRSEHDITNVFEVNGKISNIVRVPDEPHQPEGRTLIVYESEQAILKIDPSTLGEVVSPLDPTVKWVSKTVRDITQEEMGKEVARRYLKELEFMGGSGRAGFLSIFQGELQASPTPQTETRSPVDHNVNTTADIIPNTDSSEPVEPTSAFSPHTDTFAGPVHVDESIYNPSHIQKVVVEHVIRNEPSHAPLAHAKIRTFSGRLPRPNGEVDYETWRTQVDLLLSDPFLTDALKVRKILESLLSPASEIVKPLGVTATPSTYVTQLDSAYGVVEDGEELYTAFLGSNQNSGENPSAFLNRLHSLLTRVISRGGAPPTNVNELLLKQFIRGCWDQSLIISLQLEAKKSFPPSFSELLLMLRTEEERRFAKLDRMKKHLGATKAAAHAHSVFSMPTFGQAPLATPTPTDSEAVKLEQKVNELTKQVEQLTLTQRPRSTTPSTEPLVSTKSKSVNPKPNETAKLESQIAELTKQVQMLVQSQRHSTKPEKYEPKNSLAVNTRNSQTFAKVPGTPRAWFCFKCGEDNHIAVSCTNDANPTLVREKHAELRKKQADFAARQATAPFALN